MRSNGDGLPGAAKPALQRCTSALHQVRVLQTGALSLPDIPASRLRPDFLLPSPLQRGKDLSLSLSLSLSLTQQHPRITRKKGRLCLAKRETHLRVSPVHGPSALLRWPPWEYQALLGAVSGFFPGGLSYEPHRQASAPLKTAFFGDFCLLVPLPKCGLPVYKSTRALPYLPLSLSLYSLSLSPTEYCWVLCTAVLPSISASATDNAQSTAQPTGFARQWHQW